ncbi:thioesterase [Paenibacillus sp. MZ04-78.2]|uniref:thioesterase family protein n=1 Tax=Paenibacillus sp. MZ04-78.2 TaxID=2962034 RepID=UPI0020B6F401|nr:thioesterase [Paenibacillus sp. MZ04-78.2]MCP3772750.1 thioesterase [Paenibacillus sp. MZ04-78.2]
MRQGLVPGIEVEFQILVEPSMRPAFDGKVVHDVMSTVTMIYYMEKAGREIIVPYLEDGEEGAGFAIDVKHVGLALVGQEVKFKAVCTEVSEKRVVCEVKAETDRHVVGIGLFTQAIFQKQDMERRIRELKESLLRRKNL